MKPAIFILIYTIYAIYKATKKAQEKARFAALKQTTTEALTRSVSPEPDEPATVVPEWSDRFADSYVTITNEDERNKERFVQMESAARSKTGDDTLAYTTLQEAVGRLRPDTRRVTVDEPLLAMIQEAPQQRAGAIKMDKDSLRNYIAIREILGKPRSKMPYRPPAARQS